MIVASTAKRKVRRFLLEWRACVSFKVDTSLRRRLAETVKICSEARHSRDPTPDQTSVLSRHRAGNCGAGNKEPAPPIVSHLRDIREATLTSSNSTGEIKSRFVETGKSQVPKPTRWSREQAQTVASRWPVAQFSRRRLSPVWLGSVSCSRSSNRTCGTTASGSRRKCHEVAHGRLPVRAVRRTRPNT